ncbi:11101_t:CDS:1, partial [Scutellospora calospora]
VLHAFWIIYQYRDESVPDNEAGATLPSRSRNVNPDNESGLTLPSRSKNVGPDNEAGATLPSKSGK